jgi:hypothetical protein
MSSRSLPLRLLVPALALVALSVPAASLAGEATSTTPDAG